jgi:hypothetical protein
VWLVLGLGALMWFLAWTREGRNWLDEGTFIWTGLGLHTLFKWWVALEAPRQFGQDRRSGAIELILSTPLSVDRVLRGQAMALIAQFGPAVLLVCVIDVFFLVFGFRHVGSSDHQIWIAMWLAGLIIFIVDLVAIASLAMWRSLVSRKPGHAPANAVVAVCVLPWTLFGIVCAALVFMEEVLRQRTFLSNATAVTMIGMWFVISLAIAGAITVSSIRKLRRRFRDAATQRLESTGARLGRWLGRKFAHSRR